MLNNERTASHTRKALLTPRCQRMLDFIQYIWIYWMNCYFVICLFGWIYTNALEKKLVVHHFRVFIQSVVTPYIRCQLNSFCLFCLKLFSNTLYKLTIVVICSKFSIFSYLKKNDISNPIKTLLLLEIFSRWMQSSVRNILFI